MGNHISSSGWNNWSNPDNERTARFGEFASYGPGANPKARFNWTTQLTAEEAEKYLPAQLFAGADEWNPATELSLVQESAD